MPEKRYQAAEAAESTVPRLGPENIRSIHRVLAQKEKLYNYYHIAWIKVPKKYKCGR